FFTALKNNSLYAIASLVFQVGAGLIIAAILEDKLIRKFQPFFRTVFFLPSVISIAVVGLVWQLLYNPEVGLVNGVLKAIGQEEWARSWL
ncbi:sugar ABC transporter permease, partial [Alkalihalophilus lindianensis]|nr:sugar ABC transporter permease [Alkalihalophilus lindianensis]